ncbi:MAG: hypothetical protein RBU30_18065, partial [Polyangia bacterium]|nr:hypothetical protein [Polyangia bacterium]
QGILVWIVGNEPNLNWGYMFTPEEYGEIYHRVIQAVKALPQGEDHEVLFASPGIWANVAPWGNWDDGLSTSLAYVLSKPGGLVDGGSIHAYTRGHETAYITSDEWFPGFTNKWHLHFRIYRDFLRVYADRGLLDVPLYITESGSACDPPCDPYADQDKGYFLAMYEEIHQWNQANPQQVIRAVTPYRWTQNDDGTNRDFCIGCSAPLVQDMTNAIALARQWHPTSCHEPFDPPDAGPDAALPADAAPADAAGPAPDGEAAVDSGSPDASQAGDAQQPADSGGGGGGPGMVSGCNCQEGQAGSPRRSGGLTFLAIQGLLLLGLCSRRANRRRRRLRQ